MKKAITLPQFVKDFPKDKCFVKEEFHRLSDVDYDYNKDLSYSQKLKYVGYIYKTITKLSVTDNCIYYIRLDKRINRRGKTFYPSCKTRECIYIGKKEIRLTTVSDQTLFEFISLLDINWFKDINHDILKVLFKNKTIFRRLITNRIYNEETLYKSALSCVYQLKDISWKTVRKYYNWIYGKDIWHRLGYVSLADLYYFTKNIDQTVDILYSSKILNIYSDLLFSAIDLNEVVDFTWSQKRIAEEHKRQTQTLMAKEISAKKETPIYDITNIQFSLRLLNTEKDIFLEGKVMHHCLYNCYYNKIYNHDYIAFHLDSPEDCTLGIWMYNNKPTLDQIYKKYDQTVSEETRKYAEAFIESHQDDLIKLFNQKVKEELPLIDGDLSY